MSVRSDATNKMLKSASEKQGDFFNKGESAF